MNDTASLLDRIAAHAITLYSRPTVAMDIVRLTEQPQVDSRALKECIEGDPALTGKILRVVNSSLYGLSTPVGDLKQALALLGIKPLKLLVLGFSLPDTLFAGVAAKQLQWYWTGTLTRAVAARLISEQCWDQPGDEAFTVALLQDIGILLLLGEMGQPYAKFLAGVIQEKRDLALLERDTIHFDHIQLSAALLTRWRLPPHLIDAIAAPREVSQLAQIAPPAADLPQILHLADMLVALVAHRRLHVLPKLMEAAAAYRQVTKRALMAIVEQLQPQVEQLADVLTLELAGDRNYLQTLIEAHQRLGLLAEELAGESTSPVDDPAYARLMANSRELSAAMQSFLHCDAKVVDAEDSPNQRWGQQHAAHQPTSERGPVAYIGQVQNTSQLLRKLQFAGNRCRERRQELSLLLVEPNVFDVHADPQADVAARQVRRALGHACAGLDQNSVTLVSLSPERTAVILCNCERRAAVDIAQDAMARLAPSTGTIEQHVAQLRITLSAGVATASGVPKNFDPTNMFDSAQRCLSAARACGISTVKSIEV